MCWEPALSPPTGASSEVSWVEWFELVDVKICGTNSTTTKKTGPGGLRVQMFKGVWRGKTESVEIVAMRPF